MNLIKFLKENENTRKIFGERELKIIEKQLIGINLTQSEKNRLSRDIRKKLRFIKDITNLKNEFELKKGNENKKIIHEAIKEILNHPMKNKIKEILLFGSIVKNEVTIRSDIDIAVKFSKINLKEATKFRIEAPKDLPRKVDIQVFRFLPKKIQKSILKNHRILYRIK